ncbi:MAG TPA: HPF/RaiA family ribosome-associated protein, partial [Myxococcales bacterium]|nr:HPF/RaiA family ribosome-associated protein [Myxococcales bacterium]
MLIPLQITYRGMKESDALSELVRTKVQKLERFYRRISSCRVLIEQPHHHKLRGEHFHVRIDLTVPGGELLVEREPSLRDRHKDAYVAVSDAFRSARRALQDHVHRRREFIELHAGTPHGRVKKVFHAEGFGFIETDDGREIYFDTHSVLNDAFGRLVIGARVR